MSTEELKVVLRRSSEYSGFGFSLLGSTGPPHVIYDIVENSPAADCGVVEAGDVILKVNGTDVHRYTTKEVLKCLRLSEDLVTLELKRDPKLKARIKEQLANTTSPHYIDIEPANNYDYHHSTTTARTSSPHHHHHYQHHEAANKLHYETTHNYTTIQQQSSPTSSTPAAIRYKSTTSAAATTVTTTTNLPQRQCSNTTNHSRSSSASSAKIQLAEGLGEGSGAGTGTSTTTATSPTSRPSRIPQALKCPLQKSQQSPQHKRPRPSQIPTKASIAAAAAAAASAAAVSTTTTATTTTNGNTFMMGSNNLQHSNSYSGNTTRHGKSSSSSYAAEEREPEPNSAPPQPAKAPRFEAYMMTGDLILNLSRTPQNSNLLPMQAKKVDSLRDSPGRAAVARANGALAPKASGESSPTSSSSQESPTHSTDSAELQNKAKSRLRKNQQAQAQLELEQEQQQQQQQQQQQHQQQYQRDSINNSYNNRKDSLTNDTLLLCEELEKDDEDIEDDDDEEGNAGVNRYRPHHYQHQKTKHHHYMQKHKKQCYQQQTRLQQQQLQNKSYEYYQNEDEEPCEDYDRYAGEDDENDEDQTNYDITNLETYNSGGGAGSMGISGQADDEASDRQCLMHYGDDDDNEQAEDEEYLNSIASASTKQRLKALKQKASSRYKQQRNSQDNVDCARHQRSSASSASSTTVGNTGAAGNNTSQDETSFSVPTSPISLSTPLIDKETANSVPTSPEPSNLAAGSGVCGAENSGVVRRHNGQLVRKCDSAGFRTSKSEDHLQQIQREGMGAVIPIDIDEDVNSSLNTLLDTRQDSEDSQQSSSSTKTCIQITFNKNNHNNNTITATTTTITTNLATTTTTSTNILCASPEAHSQRDIFNKRRRKVRIIITPTSQPPTLSSTTTITATSTTRNMQLATASTEAAMTTNTTSAPSSTTRTVSCITSTIQQTDIQSSNLTIQKASDRDRIVWTYNAPLQPHQLAALQQQQQQQQQYSTNYGSNNSHNHSHSSSISSSPHHSAGSPASPTSVSSSVMSSSGSKGALGIGGNFTNNNGHNYQQQQQQQQQQQYQQYNVVVTNGSINNSCGTNSITTNMSLLHCTNGGTYGGSGGGGGGGNSSGGNNSCTNTNNTLGGCGGGGTVAGGGGGDQSVSEAISNISSPDYQDDDNLLSSRDLLGSMILSDPSDSDSTILVSDAAVQRQQKQRHHQQQQQKSSEHKVVIQVRGADTNNTNSNNSFNNNGSSLRSLGSDLKNSEDELATLAEDAAAPMHQQSTSPNSNSASMGDGRESSPPVSDDGSDVESLHSYHYSPKAVDMPSAIRLAKRLYTLDGFKKSDVSRHLSKNNDFNRAVADEYLKYFSFENKTLDQSLREFLQQFSLSGETQERERVLVHFSKRYLDCNPGTFNSQDAVHTLTCAIMLLNTDLHGQNIGRKMTCNEFIENLAELNDGENFPKDVLKYLYQAIKSQPLEWALDDDPGDLQKLQGDNNSLQQNTGQLGQNPFLDIPEAANAVEYKKGYVMRKCCYDVNYKKTPFGKRSWKMFYCTLRDLVLYLHKDEHGFRKSQMSDNLHNAIRIHHALATKAVDYTKKQHVFRLQTADQAEYLFQTSDSKELQSWVETINFVCAAYSAPPLEGGVGSQKRFQRPLLPSSHTKLLLKEQLESHEQQLNKLDNTILEHKKGPIPSKGLALQNYKEKELFLQYELRRYKAYVSILTAKILADQQQYDLQQCNQLNEEDTDKFFKSQVVAQQPIRLQPMPTSSAAPNSINVSEQQQLQQSSQPQLQQQQQASSGNRKKEKKK